MGTWQRCARRVYPYAACRALRRYAQRFSGRRRAGETATQKRETQRVPRVDYVAFLRYRMALGNVHLRNDGDVETGRGVVADLSLRDGAHVRRLARLRVYLALPSAQFRLHVRARVVGNHLRIFDVEHTH